jgi:FkbM family methyltransferase
MNNYDKLTMNEKRQFWIKNPLNGNILIKIDDIEFYMKCNNDDTVVKELYHSNFKGWERNEINFIKELTTKKKYEYFFDIGSYTGFYSLLMSKINSDIKIFSFEIIDFIKKRFDENILINKFTNITTFNKGIDSKRKKNNIQLGWSQSDSVLTSVSRITNYNTGKKIDCISIDDFVKENDKPIKNKNIFMKIDTEGTELNVVKGMLKLLNENNVDMLIEINDRNKSKFSNILKGYEIREFGRNFFFIKSNNV